MCTATTRSCGTALFFGLAVAPVIAAAAAAAVAEGVRVRGLFAAASPNRGAMTLAPMLPDRTGFEALEEFEPELEVEREEGAKGA